MLKFLFKISIVVLLLFGVSNYSNYLISGQTPEINSDKSVLPDINISNLKNTISNKFKSTKKEKPTIVKESYLYKWRDAKGVIHYTSEKPHEDVNNLETIKLSNNTNIVPSALENDTETQSKSTQHAQLPSTNLPANIYSPEGIKHLFEQAKSIQNLMNRQFSQQENIINEN